MQSFFKEVHHWACFYHFDHYMGPSASGALTPTGKAVREFKGRIQVAI